jgi:hypothetical protein
MIYGRSRGDGIKKTDDLFEITKKRKLLEEEFK